MELKPIGKFRSTSLPHIQCDAAKEPSPHFSFHTRIKQYAWKNNGKFALLFSLFLSTAILVPYTLSLLNGSVKPILPLIRQESDSETKRGLFSIALYLTSLLGAVMASVRYVHVLGQNESKNWRLNVLNKLGLGSGFVSFAGLIIVASFRVTVPDTPAEQLESSMFVPHIIGGFCAVFFGALYLIFQTGISLFYYEGNARTVMLRFTIFLLCSVCIAASVVSSVSQNKISQHSSDIYLQSGITVEPLEEPKNTVRNIAEWLLVFFFATYFLTFVKESQNISVAITFRHLMTGRRISIASLTNMSKM